MKKNISKNNIFILYTISNEHLSEMVSEYENIVKYKTGFTGDTAMYLENGKKGYLIVDGRFSIQARKEIDKKKIKVVDVGRDYNLYDFLKKVLSKGNNSKIIYVDYKRESIGKVKKIEKCIKEIFENESNNGIDNNLENLCNKSIINIESNKNNYNNKIAKLDNVVKNDNINNKNNIKCKIKLSNKDLFADKGFMSYRKNIFHMTSAPLFLLDKSKIRLFDKNIKDVCLDGADVYITSSKEEIAYLTNLRYEFCDINNTGVLFDGYLVLYNDKSYLYIHDYVKEDIEKIFNKHKVYIKNYNDFYKDIKNIKNKKINLDKDINNYYIYKCLNQKSVNLVDSPLDNLMSVKTDDEIKNLKKANVIDGISITNVIYELKNNYDNLSKKINENKCSKKSNVITEYDIRQYVDNERRKNKSFLCPSFDTIVAYKENSAICHYLPTKDKSKVIKKDSVLLIDSGGNYTSGTTDITRTISMYKNKKEIKKELKYHFTLVLKSMLNLQNQFFPEGYSGRELDLIARKDMYNHLLDFNHGTGHGIGYVSSVHLGPNVITSGISDNNEKNILEVNQVQSDEPGLYFDKKYGIRIENDIYVAFHSENMYGRFLKFVPLTICPIDKDLIDKKLMTDVEIRYLNEYHKFVYNNLSKYYKGKKLSWLKECCKAL